MSLLNKKIFNILLINGPNLNLLGIREPNKYGSLMLNDIILNLKNIASKLKINFSHFQSNAENELIDKIHQSYKKINFLIINPGAYTHTSIAIRDALLAVNIPFIEIHISNIYSREKFRHYSYFSDIAVGVISGLGPEGYYVALKIAFKYLYTNTLYTNTKNKI